MFCLTKKQQKKPFFLGGWGGAIGRPSAPLKSIAPEVTKAYTRDFDAAVHVVTVHALEHAARDTAGPGVPPTRDVDKEKDVDNAERYDGGEALTGAASSSGLRGCPRGGTGRRRVRR